jgi:hypothetical protein
LIRQFEFSPTGKKLAWLSNGVAQPTVHDPTLPEDGRNITQLPLNIKRVAA